MKIERTDDEGKGEVMKGRGNDEGEGIKISVWVLQPFVNLQAGMFLLVNHYLCNAFNQQKLKIIISPCFPHLAFKVANISLDSMSLIFSFILCNFCCFHFYNFFPYVPWKIFTRHKMQGEGERAGGGTDGQNRDIAGTLQIPSHTN